jgi:hypothetical protein
MPFFGFSIGPEKNEIITLIGDYIKHIFGDDDDQSFTSFFQTYFC